MFGLSADKVRQAFDQGANVDLKVTRGSPSRGEVLRMLEARLKSHRKAPFLFEMAKAGVYINFVKRMRTRSNGCGTTKERVTVGFNVMANGTS